jgi:hypothetical protein
MERDLSQWCPACNAWRIEIKKHDTRKHVHIDWTKHDSGQWDTCPRDVAKVYLPTTWSPNIDPNFESDLSSITSLMRNCLEFKVASNVAKAASETRNTLAHYGSTTLKLTNQQTVAAFVSLTNLLKDPDVASHNCSAANVTALAKIQSRDLGNELSTASQFDIQRIETQIHALTTLVQGTQTDFEDMNTLLRNSTLLSARFNFSGLSCVKHIGSCCMAVVQVVGRFRRDHRKQLTTPSRPVSVMLALVSLVVLLAGPVGWTPDSHSLGKFLTHHEHRHNIMYCI